MHPFFNKIKTISTGLILFLLLFAGGCGKESQDEPPTEDPKKSYISSVDISRYPEILEYNPVFYDQNNQQKDFLTQLKESGVNTIRLKLWVDPATVHASFGEVKQFSQTLHSKGFKTWLTLHYSDTWADPANQATPARWQNLNFDALKDSVYAYTVKVVDQMNPDFIQIGNEINPGFLHPLGNINNFVSFRLCSRQEFKLFAIRIMIQKSSFITPE